MPVAATIWEWSLPPIFGKILFYGWVIISFAMLDLDTDPLWCRKPQVEISRVPLPSCFLRFLSLYEAPLCSLSSRTFARPNFLSGPKSKVQCLTTTLSISFNHIIVSVIYFSIWEKMRGAVGWCRLTKPLTTSCFNVVYLKNGQPAQFQWNLIISHIFPIFNDHSTAAIPLFHLERAWRRR